MGGDPYSLTQITQITAQITPIDRAMPKPQLGTHTSAVFFEDNNSDPAKIWIFGYSLINRRNLLSA